MPGNRVQLRHEAVRVSPPNLPACLRVAASRPLPPPSPSFYVFNHSSDAVINGQRFQDWFVDSYVFNAAGESPLVAGFFWDDFWSPSGNMGDNTPNATRDSGSRCLPS